MGDGVSLAESKTIGAMFLTFKRLSAIILDLLLASVSRLVSALASNRSLTVMTLAGCVVLITGPWLRPPMMRDFRGPHIPIGEITIASFRPELAQETPRPWRLDSVATPLLTVCLVGAAVVLVRPDWMSRVFGALLAVSLAAFAIALWNYPTLIESFESDMRDRALLRAVFRQHSEHMLAAGTPDRLAALGNRATREDLLVGGEHPLWLPLRYSAYGGWLIGIALVATIVSRRGPWPQRFMYAGGWSAAGLMLALAATWPRLAAEYHFARADALERANHFDQAELSLDAARNAMPCMEDTRRYWLAKGRLDVRRGRTSDQFASFYLAHQAMLSGDLTNAHAVLEPSIRRPDATVAQRDLLAGILAQRAAEYVSDAKYSAAELCWDEASAVAPWKGAYRIAHGAAQVAAAPHRAGEIDERLIPMLSHLGDRMVASDVYSLVGDAHFLSGEFVRARQMYDRSIGLFQTPKYVNVPAQEGRLGM
jgi:hypothetical protein